MTQNDNEMIAQEFSKLLSEIQDWRGKTVRFRMLNIYMFAGFKVLIPMGSIAVAASAFSQLQGQPLFSPIATLILAGLVVVLSGLDSILNPGARKRVAFKKNNALRELEARIGIKFVQSNEEEQTDLILKGNSELKEILDEYAEKGY